MFKIVASFFRNNLDHKLFYDEFFDHRTITLIHEKFYSSIGFVKKEIIKETELQIDIAMVFETETDFLNFAINNQELLEERSKLINEWLTKTGHSYKYYTITD